MTNETLIKELVETLRQFDGMWVDRTIALLDVLSGTEINPRSPTLLADMHAARFDHPDIGKWLFDLPGHRVGDFEVAERHIGYLTMQIRAIPIGSVVG